MAKLFVVGGAGFIGSHFIKGILSGRRAIEVLNFDLLKYSGNLENLKEIAHDCRYRFVRGDIGDISQLGEALRKFKPDYVINFAAETHVDRSIQGDIGEFVDANIVGVFNLLELVRANPYIKKYVQVSTDEVYGSLPLRGGKLFEENTAFAPNTPYAATKAGGDLLCRAYARTFGVPVVVTHSSNNYGPCQYPEKLIPFFISRIMEGKTLPIYGDGKNVRDWIYVKDHCAALELCLFKGRPGEVYNIGGGCEKSNLSIASYILNYFGLPQSRIEFVKNRPGHDRRYALRAKKIQKELGWRPSYKFDEAFPATLEWYIARPEWIADLRVKGGRFNSHIDSSAKKG
jgi:dTDP-glucose 4,6-dehydratase